MMGCETGRQIREEIARVVDTLVGDALVDHEAVKLLFAHGSRPWEDAV